ncbi:tyrosine-type recombinase/integrase [Candidatus Pristimantibacillus sp. PTI5]|uniref:tyrosine-type recombinase/integrase n=1 Tax=Candidatus Pristimantibacillus sp. PTI5 TaxID=3400422 RepID=UPI003B01205B
MVFLLLKFAIQNFIGDREYKNLSINTIKAYQMELNTFHAYCVSQEMINVEDITQSFVKQYLVYCQKERNNNPTTRNTKLRSIKAFFNYLEDEEITKSPLAKMHYVKEQIKIEAFTDNQIKTMLTHYSRIKNYDKSYIAYRDYVIILVLLGTGVRLGELINLKWSDVDLTNRIVTVFGKKRELSSIPMTNRLVLELSEYKLFCQQHYKTMPDYLFVSARSKMQMTPDATKSIFKRLKASMLFNDKVRISAHTFRHTFAHMMLMNGCDVFTLQKMLRHTDIKMTEKYLSLWGTALAEINNKFNPLSNIDI